MIFARMKRGGGREVVLEKVSALILFPHAEPKNESKGSALECSRDYKNLGGSILRQVCVCMAGCSWVLNGQKWWGMEPPCLRSLAWLPPVPETEQLGGLDVK